MQQALPEDLWFFIILTALLILAYLWNDRGGEGKPVPPEPERHPEINILDSRGSKTPGEECWMKVSYNKGTGKLDSLEAKINGESVGIREENDRKFVSNPAQVQEGRNVLKASITTTVGSASDSKTFSGTQKTVDDGPTVLINHEIVDESNGVVEIEASAEAGTSPVVGTAIKLSRGNKVVTDESRDSDYCRIKPKNLPEGNYVIDAMARDENSLTDEKTETFRLESDRPEVPRGPGGPGSGMPGIFNPQIEASPEINLNVPEEALEVLQGIIGDLDGSGEVSQEVGMEGYQILMAMHMLQQDLDGQDNQAIVNELEMIRQSMDQGQVSAGELESSLRTVLHDVFGQDLQDVLQGLEVNGLDEDAIVQAIRDNEVDTGPLVARLSNIEQAIDQVSSQGGGDFQDLERKLDQIEDAVRDTQLDEDMMQKFISQLQGLGSEGVDVDVDATTDEAVLMRLMDDIQSSQDPDVEMNEVLEVIREQGRLNRELLRELIEEEETGSRPNINPANMVKSPGEDGSGELDEIEGRMDTQIQVEIEELETEYENLEKMIEGTNDIERLEQSLNQDIGEVVKHLKKARQFEHHLQKHQNGQLENSQIKELLEEDIPKIRSEIKRADRAIRQLKKDMRNMREEFSNLTDLEGNFNELVEKLAEQKEALDETEQMLEGTENDLMDSGIDTID